MTTLLRTIHESDGIVLAEFHARAVRHSFKNYYPVHVVEAWAASRSPEGYLRNMHKGESFLIATRNNIPVGFIGWMNGELTGMYVDPNHHGKGIGKQLVQAALQQAEHNGQPITHVKAAQPARGFYEKMGFRFTSTGTFKIRGHVLQDIRLTRP